MENAKQAEPLEQRLKKRLFGLFDHVISLSIWNSVLYIIVLILEMGIFLNLTYYTASRTEESTASIKNLSVINPISLLEIDGVAVYVQIFFITFGILFDCLFVLLIIFQIFSTSPLNSWIYTYSSKIYGFLGILIKNIFIQPYIYIAISSFYCKNNYGYDCDGNMSIFLKAASPVTAISFLIWIFLEILFFADEQINSTLPWAYCSRTYEICKLISKIIISIANKSENPETNIFLLCFAAIASLYEIFQLFKQGYMTTLKF